MPSITITDESGQLTVAIDGAEPEPVETAEDACQIVEATFGQGEAEPVMEEPDAMESAQKGYGSKPRLGNGPSVGQVFGG